MKFFCNKNRKFCEFIVAFLLLNLLIYLINIEYFNKYINLVIGFSLYTLILYFSARFVYLGVGISVLYSTLGSYFMLMKFFEEKKIYYLSVLMLQSCSVVGSIIIGIFSDLNKRTNNRFKSLSEIDYLTNIYNNRYFQKRLEGEMSRAIRNSTSLSLIIFDIDHFKKINQQYGHKVGDEILIEIADLVSRTLRGEDIFCRYGGDKFIILLPGSGLEESQKVILRIIEALKVFNNKEKRIDLSLSFGFSDFPIFANDENQLLAQADSALYSAKQSGRNTFRMYFDIFDSVRANLKIEDENFIHNLKILLWTLTSKDYYTYGHSERVAGYAVATGQVLKLSKKSLNLLQIEGLLHDIGKIEIPLKILNKNTKLSDGEYDIVRKHVLIGTRILEPLSEISGLIKDIRGHHEWYNGNGYPDGLKGDEISLLSKILGIADVYDALRSDRPYRKGLNKEEAKKILINGKGKQFDPNVLEVFIEHVIK